MAVFPKAWREGAESREKDGEGSALRPDHITEAVCCLDQKLLDSTPSRNFIFSFQAEEKVPS